MINFSDACMDMARAILSHNISSINEDGTIMPVAGEIALENESGHAAFALGEFYRATQQETIDCVDIVKLEAACVNSQLQSGKATESGLAYAALGLLSFGPSKDRNKPYALISEETRKAIDIALLNRSDYFDYRQAFNIGKSVTRFSLGLSKKDETPSLIDRFIERLNKNSSGGYCDTCPKTEINPDVLGGEFGVYGLLDYVFIRQCLQLHANVHLRERKLPSLRTPAERYLKLIPEIVREDGMGFAYGANIGAYGQMHMISFILQSMRDGWILPDQMPLYKGILTKLYQYFYTTYFNPELGMIVIRDCERDTDANHSTRMANFDAARYLCQWSRLAKTIGGTLADAKQKIFDKSAYKLISFDKCGRKEQALIIYRNPATNLYVQIPIVSNAGRGNSDSLAFPHMPGVFDSPVNKYVPAFIPEFVIGDQTFTPSYYAKNIKPRMGARPGSFIVAFEQPDLITVDEKIVPAIASMRVEWEFSGSKIVGRWTIIPKTRCELKTMRIVNVTAACHSTMHCGNAFRLGEKNVGCQIVKDDFGGQWLPYVDVSQEADRTRAGKIYYYQEYLRAEPLKLLPGKAMTIEVAYEPDIATVY